jgi:hypothetical protein
MRTKIFVTQTWIFVLLFVIGAIFLSILALPTILSGQVSDTIQITITGRITDVTLTAEYVTPFQVGDTAILKAVVLDEDSLPIAAQITFFTEDSTALRLEDIVRSDYPIGQKHARAIALRKATVRVWVMVEPITEMRLASFRDGVLNWSRNDTLHIWQYTDGRPTVYESLQYCAWLTRGTELVAESPGPPLCPAGVFVPPSLPRDHILASAVSNMDRSVPPGELARLARGVPRLAAKN